MTYDNWKSTNPADEELGSRPQGPMADTNDTFLPGDRIKVQGIPGIVVDDEDTTPGMVAVVWHNNVCSGVWYLLPQNLELIRKAEED